MAGEKLTKREEALAKRAGKGGREFVLARRKRPGLSLLEYQASRDEELVEAAPEPEPAPKAAKAAKTTPGGSSAR